MSIGKRAQHAYSELAAAQAKVKLAESVVRQSYNAMKRAPVIGSDDDSVRKAMLVCINWLDKKK